MKRLMSKIAYVKQNDVFFEHLTVRDQVRLQSASISPCYSDYSTLTKRLVLSFASP